MILAFSSSSSDSSPKRKGRRRRHRRPWRERQPFWQGGGGSATARLQLLHAAFQLENQIFEVIGDFLQSCVFRLQFARFLPSKFFVSGSTSHAVILSTHQRVFNMLSSFSDLRSQRGEPEVPTIVTDGTVVDPMLPNEQDEPFLISLYSASLHRLCWSRGVLSQGIEVRLR